MRVFLEFQYLTIQESKAEYKCDVGYFHATYELDPGA